MDAEKLIEAVRSFPCLWDVSSKSYKDLRARENAWKEVVSQVGEGVTVEQCSKKWKNLRDHFVREMKKKPSGEKGPAFVSRWPHYEMMTFLNNAVRHRTSYSNFGGGCESTESVLEEEVEELEVPETEMDDSMVNTEVDSLHSTSVPPSSSVSPCTPSTSSAHSNLTSKGHHQRGSKRQRISRDEEIDEAICEGLHESRRRWDKRDEPEVADKNPEMSFGRHVGERLSRMTPYQKAIAQVKMQQVLLEEFPADQFHQQPIPRPQSNYFPNNSNFN